MTRRKPSNPVKNNDGWYVDIDGCTYGPFHYQADARCALECERVGQADRVAALWSGIMIYFRPQLEQFRLWVNRRLDAARPKVVPLSRKP